MRECCITTDHITSKIMIVIFVHTIIHNKTRLPASRITSNKALRRARWHMRVKRSRKSCVSFVETRTGQMVNGLTVQLPKTLSLVSDYRRQTFTACSLTGCNQTQLILWQAAIEHWAIFTRVMCLMCIILVTSLVPRLPSPREGFAHDDLWTRIILSWERACYATLPFYVQGDRKGVEKL